MLFRSEHVPELAGTTTELSRHSIQDAPTGRPYRPFWLMPEPKPLRQWRNRLFWHGPLELLAGPERIEDNWWREAISRDYYVAANPAGERYWIFRDRLKSLWFVHGVFT